MDMSGRVSLITGGAGPIGAVMAEALAELGSAVIILDIDTTECAAVAASLSDRFKVDAVPCVTDLSDDAGSLVTSR